jgi:hypothetical protein
MVFGCSSRLQVLFCFVSVGSAFVLPNVNVLRGVDTEGNCQTRKNLELLSRRASCFSRIQGISKLSMEMDLLQSLECVKNVRDMASVKGSPIKPGRNVLVNLMLEYFIFVTFIFTGQVFSCLLPGYSKQSG